MKLIPAPQKQTRTERKPPVDRGPNEEGTRIDGRSVCSRVGRLLVATTTVLSVAPGMNATELGSDAPGCSLAEPIAELAQDGDLLFRRGLSLESGLVLQLDRLGYSHVGLVRETPRGPVVIHSLPRDDEGRGGRVEHSPLGEFLAPERAKAAALYRVADNIRGATAVLPENAAVAAVSSVGDDIHGSATVGAIRWADQQVRRGTPFDYSLDPTSPNALYCTELIWAAYRAAGLELLPDYIPRHNDLLDRRSSVFRALTGRSGDFDIILPSDLAESPYVHRVLAITGPDAACP